MFLTYGNYLRGKFLLLLQKLQQEQYLRTEQYNNIFGDKLQHLLSFNR